MTDDQSYPPDRIDGLTAILMGPSRDVLAEVEVDPDDKLVVFTSIKAVIVSSIEVVTEDGKRVFMSGIQPQALTPGDTLKVSLSINMSKA